MFMRVGTAAHSLACDRRRYRALRKETGRDRTVTTQTTTQPGIVRFRVLVNAEAPLVRCFQSKNLKKEK